MTIATIYADYSVTIEFNNEQIVADLKFLQISDSRNESRVSSRCPDSSEAPEFKAADCSGAQLGVINS